MGKEIFSISEDAANKLVAMRDENDRLGFALRIAIRGRGPLGFMYQLGFVEPANRTADDTLLEFDDIAVYIDPESLPNLIGSTLTFVEESDQQGFKIDNPNPLWSDPLSLQVQEVLDKRINPSIASHGGFVSLKSVEDGVAYVILGGGCQGCGMARVTLSQGIDVMIKEMVPEIHDVVDATDHAAGENPFYRATKEGSSPLGT
jgi:Fe/S biogenesis protein NfuA